MNGISIPLYTTFTPIFVFPCLVPWPQYSTRPIRFGSRGPSEEVSFPCSFASGDIVIIMLKGDDGLPRNKWQLARVTETHQSADGHVRTVNLAIAAERWTLKGRRVKPLKFLERPVRKLVLLQEAFEN